MNPDYPYNQALAIRVHPAYEQADYALYFDQHGTQTAYFRYHCHYCSNRDELAPLDPHNHRICRQCIKTWEYLHNKPFQH
jgi:hypothetical protein